MHSLLNAVIWWIRRDGAEEKEVIIMETGMQLRRDRLRTYINVNLQKQNPYFIEMIVHMPHTIYFTSL